VALCNDFSFVAPKLKQNTTPNGNHSTMVTKMVPNDQARWYDFLGSPYDVMTMQNRVTSSIDENNGIIHLP